MKPLAGVIFVLMVGTAVASAQDSSLLTRMERQTLHPFESWTDEVGKGPSGSAGELLGGWDGPSVFWSRGATSGSGGGETLHSRFPLGVEETLAALPASLQDRTNPPPPRQQPPPRYQQPPQYPGFGRYDDKRIQISLRAEAGGSGLSVGSIFAVEAEFGFKSGLSLAPMIVTYQYSYEDDGECWEEEETGSGAGLGFEFRWYVTRRAFHGFYLGTGAAIFFVAEWEWSETDGLCSGPPYTTLEEDGDETAYAIWSAIGYTFRAGPVIGISPTFIAGWSGSDAEEGLGPFAGIGVRFSVAF